MHVCVCLIYIILFKRLSIILFDTIVTVLSQKLHVPVQNRLKEVFNGNIAVWLIRSYRKFPKGSEKPRRDCTYLRRQAALMKIRYSVAYCIRAGISSWKYIICVTFKPYKVCDIQIFITIGHTIYFVVSQGFFFFKI